MEPEDVGDDSQPVEAEEELLVPAVITEEFFENLCLKTNSVSFAKKTENLYNFKTDFRQLKTFKLTNNTFWLKIFNEF